MLQLARFRISWVNNPYSDGDYDLLKSHLNFNLETVSQSNFGYYSYTIQAGDNKNKTYKLNITSPDNGGIYEGATINLEVDDSKHNKIVITDTDKGGASVATGWDVLATLNITWAFSSETAGKELYVKTVSGADLYGRSVTFGSDVQQLTTMNAECGSPVAKFVPRVRPDMTFTLDAQPSCSNGGADQEDRCSDAY